MASTGPGYIRFSNGGAIILALFLFTTKTPVLAYAQSQPSLGITFINSLGEPIVVYFQPESLDHFLKPPLALSKNQAVRLPLNKQYPGKRYVVVRTESRAVFNIGWYDFERVARSRVPKIYIDGDVVYETKECTKTVHKREQKVIVDKKGNRRIVTVMVPEEVSYECRVPVRNIYLRVMGEDGWERLGDAPPAN